MEFNLEEVKRKTLEFFKATSYSLVRPEFNDYSPVYAATTEDISYLEHIDVNGKDALTVTGSFDHCLNLICEGARSVCNFDVNISTIFYANFKLAAMKTFSYQEYVDFLLGGNRFEYHGYLKLREYLDPEYQEYWDFIYKTFDYSGEALANSRLFYALPTEKTFFHENPYLKSEEAYERTKRRLNEVPITFEVKNILEIGEGEETYDIMLFSNIESYLVQDSYHIMEENEYLDFIKNKASKQLNDGGIIQMAYRYNYREKETKKKFFFKVVSTRRVNNWDKDYLDCYKGIFLDHLKDPQDNRVLQDCAYIYVKDGRVKTR